MTAQLEDSGQRVLTSITEVTEVLTKNAVALGMDKIHPEMLKSLDMISVKASGC